MGRLVLHIPNLFIDYGARTTGTSPVFSVFRSSSELLLFELSVVIAAYYLSWMILASELIYKFFLIL